MLVSLNWLKDFVDIDMPPEELAKLLTMNALEVETFEPLGHSLDEIVAGKILSVKSHPDADRLSICLVDTGSGEVPVVCGAPNVAEGAVAAMAPRGTKLPGGMVIEETRIRGQRSVGMLLAEDEMGLTEDHTGILLLPPDTQPGVPVFSILPVKDCVLEIGITPNRPDCTSIMGIAREIAALTGQKLKRPATDIRQEDESIHDLASVSIEDPDGCPRYSAGMIRNVVLKPSPFWMRYRLHVCGMRGISNVVDITNYVLLEMGQPLHAFDYERLQENRIVVRRAREGETFTTLDGNTRIMSEENLMICDGRRSVGLAGIMGGLNSEIFAGSKHVLIESAFFDPVTIRRGSKFLNLSTEASYRFERGIDIENAVVALKRALYLMAEYAEGKICKDLIDIYSKPYRPKAIDVRVDKTNQLLGTDLSRETIAGYFRALELDVKDVDENLLRVEPPAFRVDLTREVDLMEEVARLEGYDRIPVTSPPVRPYIEEERPVLFQSDGPREIMVGLGFTEIISYSFISPDSADMLGMDAENPLRSFIGILNPLSVEQSVMRTSLVPGLLEAVTTNIAYEEENLRLFEWGRVFLRREGEELPKEKPFLSAVMTDCPTPNSWYATKRNLDFYDIKGVLEALLKGLRLKEIDFKRGPMPAHYDAEISARIELQGIVAGHIGKLASEVVDRYEIKSESVYLFELDMEYVLGKMLDVPIFEPFSKFPPAYRDISLVVHKGVESAEIMKVIRREAGAWAESVELYDVFEGGKIPSSERALTYRICYRSKEGTLDGKEVNRVHEGVIQRIQEKTGGRLREA